MSIPCIAQIDLLCAARDLASLDGENPEYDRALVELVTEALGLSDFRADHSEMAYLLVLGVAL